MMKSRQYRCFFEGQQEEMYFNHVAKILREYDSELKIKFDKAPKIDSLENMATSVPKLAVIDYDFMDDLFERNIKTCKKTRILYTNVSFDLWLLLHKRSYNAVVTNTSSYTDLIRREYGLNKTAHIKNKETIEKILQQIGIQEIKNAINNAKNIMRTKLECDKKNVRKGFCYYDNPSLNIHEFFEELFDDLGI